MSKDACNYAVMDLLQLTEEEIWQLPEGIISITFGDGRVMRTTRGRTIISWYMWEPIRSYPGLIPLWKHHIGNGRLVKGMEMDIMSVIFWDTYDAHIATHPNTTDNFIWDLSYCLYSTMNKLHNLTLTHLGEYVTTVDLSDIDAVLTHPEVKEAKELAALEKISITEAHNRIIKVMESDDPALRGNGLAMMARTGVLSLNQLVQFIGPRGFVRKTNGDNFKLPIDVGYVDGLSTLYDSATESRSASTSYYMNDRPLQDSEYFNRMMQLFTGVIQAVEGSDCKTPHTLPWKVESNDVVSLYGKYHMVDGKPVPIRPEYVKVDGEMVEVPPEKHSLVGKMIQVRSITGCQNQDPTKPCATCLGEVTTVIPPRTSIGHIMTIEPLSSISQLILSTKHVIASKPSLFIELYGTAAKWLGHSREDNAKIILKKPTPSKRYVLRVLHDEFSGLNSIQDIQHPEHLSPQWISCVSTVRLALATPDGAPKGEWLTVDTTVAGRGSALSLDVLRCAIKNGVQYVDEYIDIPLTDFTGKELLIAPRGNEDMVAYLKSISGFIFGSERNNDSILNYDSCSAAIYALKSIFDKKIKVSFVHVEVFIRAAMTRDYTRNDYSLPIGGEDFKLCPAKQVISNRCVSAGLAFQGQDIMLTNPSTYLQTGKRPEFHMDPLF